MIFVTPAGDLYSLPLPENQLSLAITASEALLLGPSSPFGRAAGTLPAESLSVIARCQLYALHPIYGTIAS